jgi:hypothetical protein
VLGVLLILGFVFLGIIDRSIKNGGTEARRTLSSDFAQAGVQYAHSQLLQSQLGADWRGQPSYAYQDTTAVSSGDPDLYYLRPGTGYPLPADPNLPDLGGPDGLGPFIRLNFSNGRALVRVRYAPSDFNLFSKSPVGALRNPGQARDYLIIESVGRDGAVNVNDPTTANRSGGIQYAGYQGSQIAYQQNLALMAQADSQIPTSQKVLAMQAIGITEHSIYITNKDRVNRPAELGIPADLGIGSAYINSATLAVTPYEVGTNTSFPTRNSAMGGLGLSTLIGSRTQALNADGTSAIVNGVANTVPANGSIFSNADLKLYGVTSLSVNQSLGEGLYVAGSIIPDASAELIVDRSVQNAGGTWNEDTTTLGPTALDSRLSSFNTDIGVIRDGAGTADAGGYVRGTGRLEPPTTLGTDPQTNQNRYIESTEESGVLVNGDNSGRYGHGSGVFVDNSVDVPESSDEANLQNSGGQNSQVYDWLNPNNGSNNWVGPFYIPLGAQLQLLNDGFVITRDGRDGNWKDATGADTGLKAIRYRVGRASDGSLRILDQVTFSGNINSGNLEPSDFAQGLPFNGILYFQGNVRVQGIIPTDVQLTVVSGATIYIDGSITKGVTGTEWTASRPANSNAAGIDNHLPAVQVGAKISYPPLATIMLAAAQYVTVNTTMFLAPATTPQLATDVSGQQGYQPVKMTSSDTLHFQFGLPLQNEPSAASPAINPSNPSTWTSYLSNYMDAVNTSQSLTPQLMLVHTMADGAGSATLINMAINSSGPGTDPTKQYFFPLTSPDFPGTQYNSFAPIFQSYLPATQAMFANAAGNVSLWGMGSEAWQRYPSFEADFFPIVAPGPSTDPNEIAGFANSFSNGGGYTIHNQGVNDIYLWPGSVTSVTNNDYLLAKAAIVPDDIRIEASIYAEEGSFFVIPGPYFNVNPNDRHDTYQSLGNNPTEQAFARIQNYGSNPRFPFYGEPADIRVTIVGAISMNMPVPISEQSEWLRKWGWIPVQQGSSSANIADTHVPTGPGQVAYDATKDFYVPNLTISYDPVLATANTTGYVNSGPAYAIRVDSFGRVLPPIPRLPVSPSLAYFGDQS